jgi:hypothetical protein
MGLVSACVMIIRHGQPLTSTRAFIPELSGRSLEAVDAIFDLPWWKIGRYGGKVQASTVAENYEKGDDMKATMVHLEQTPTEKA